MLVIVLCPLVIVTHQELLHVLKLESVTVDCRLNVLLLLGTLGDSFLDRALSCDSVNGNGLGLADPMRPICRLLVHRWVPILIIEDDSVCGDQVDTESAGSRREQEAEDVVVSLILFYHVATILDRGLTIQAEETHLLPRQEVLQDVQHARHLTEDKASMLFSV